MIFNSFMKFNYSVDVWKATITIDPAGNSTTTLSFEKTIGCRVRTDGSGRSFFFAKDGDLERTDHLLNLRAPDGTSVDDKEYVITLQEPVFNAFGIKEYYRYWAMEEALA